jgi:uncharacterized spore protein YtfJ
MSTIQTVMDVVERSRETLTVKRVFGEPIERDGLTVLPAASVRGGGGGGGGGDNEGGQGGGTGFGLSARPVGAYVIRDGEVTWRPAIDLTKVILGGQVVALVAMLTFRSVVKARAKARRAAARAAT